MPNRIIKDAILVSANIDQLTADEERFFFRLLLVSDDYGRFDARPPVIRGRAYPLKPEVTDQHVLSWIAKLVEVDILHAYEINGARFVGFSNWHTYQNVRAGKSKYPSPEGAQLLHAEDIVGTGKRVLAPAIICKQTQSDDPSSRISSLASRFSSLESRVSPLVSLPEPLPADAGEKDDLGPAPVLLTETTDPQATADAETTPQQPTPDRKPRQPKLVLTGEAPSQKPPANPEHAQISADLGRWLDRYRVWRNDPKATVQFPIFAQAWKARGIDDLLLALDGLRDDDFAKTCAPKALLAESMIAKGVGIARNGRPTRNHAEGTLQIARAMVGADRDWTPPEDYR